MRVDVPVAVMSVRVVTYNGLVSGKIFFGIFQSVLLCAFGSELSVCSVHRIMADSIMVRLNIIVILVFAKAVIYFHAFRIKSKCAAVDDV